MNYLYPQDYGAVPDSLGPNSGTDSTAAIDLWRADMVAKKRPGKLEGGLFRYKPTATWDLTGVNYGFSITGDNRNGDGLALDTGYKLNIAAASGASVFYPTFSTLWICGYVNAPLLTFGRDDLADAFNALNVLRCNVNNGYPDQLNEGVRLNYVVGGEFANVVINCGGSGRPTASTAPGYGTALNLRQAVAMTFRSTQLGNAKNALRLTQGYNYGNEFSAIEIEEVDTGLTIDSATSSRNMFNSGTIVARRLFNCTAGNTNVMEMTVNKSPYAGGTTGTTIGLVLR
jgi:hypothetical protein